MRSFGRSLSAANEKLGQSGFLSQMAGTATEELITVMVQVPDMLISALIEVLPFLISRNEHNNNNGEVKQAQKL